jgi:golgin subfamily B member 1
MCCAEIEGLVQALDEEEKELELLENKSNHLEQLLQEKESALKSLDVSRTKALRKLATTVDKFDELHSLSESLLTEVENLQNQWQERDSEISFLRQEVTRSTNELLTTEESNKKYSSQINEFIKWLETTLLQFGVHCEGIDDCDCTQVPVYMDMLDKKIGSLIAESDDLRVTVQSKDSLLKVERTKTEDLLRKAEALETSLGQKDSQIGLLRRDRSSSQPSRSIYLPGTSEIEQMVIVIFLILNIYTNWIVQIYYLLNSVTYACLHNSILVQNDKVSPVAAVTQIRGARKVNNDQVSIDVEMEKDKPLDEDDDKGETDVLHSLVQRPILFLCAVVDFMFLIAAHGFKSLTMSHFVPKFTRPISDRIDGMW